ncbi:4048_t:CDS:2 [Funneliformis geosporum]|nr:4048_t:CDS:2 [Funneliformis geosporum]
MVLSDGTQSKKGKGRGINIREEKQLTIQVYHISDKRQQIASNRRSTINIKEKIYTMTLIPELQVMNIKLHDRSDEI